MSWNCLNQFTQVRPFSRANYRTNWIKKIPKMELTANLVMKLENKELSEHHKNLDGIEDYEYHEMSM